MRYRNKKAVVVCACLVLAMGVTGCATQKETPQVQHSETKEQPKSNTENEKENKGEKEEENSNLMQENHDDATSLFSSANLQGSVVEFSDSEISMSLATTQTDENGGEIMTEAAPGMEQKEELVHITYADRVIVQIMVMDSASQTQVSLSDTDKSSIKKQSSVLVFGASQDEYHWTAERVVVVKWQ